MLILCIKEISNIQLTNKAQPHATMTASESKNQKGHAKKWIWSKKLLLFLHITAVSRSPDEPTVVDATVQPIYEPDMPLNEKKKVHANNVVTASAQHYLRQ